MPSKMAFFFGVPMFVGCCAIHWMCWCCFKKQPRGHNKKKKTRGPHQKTIFISGDGWLAVFNLLPLRQLGLQIALISPRFDRLVNEHLKTRRRALDFIRIRHKKGENRKKGTQIVNARVQPLPMPTKPMPDNVIAFNGILINYLDRNGMAFLHHFRHLFTARATLSIKTHCVRLLEFILRNIPSIAGVHANSTSSGQALLIKWLCSPSPRSREAGILPPKMLSMHVNNEWEFRTTDQIKSAFDRASSPATFICVFRDPEFEIFNGCVLWVTRYKEWTNKSTGERLSVERRGDDYTLIVRCPIVRDVKQWSKWEEEAIGWDYNGPCGRCKFGDTRVSSIFARIRDGQCKFSDKRNRIIVSMRNAQHSVGDGLLDINAASAAVLGPSVQQQ